MKSGLQIKQTQSNPTIVIVFLLQENVETKSPALQHKIKLIPSSACIDFLSRSTRILKIH